MFGWFEAFINSTDQSQQVLSYAMDQNALGIDHSFWN